MALMEQANVSNFMYFPRDENSSPTPRFSIEFYQSDAVSTPVCVTPSDSIGDGDSIVSPMARVG